MCIRDSLQKVANAPSIPARTAPVAETHAYSSGKATGMNKIANMTSLPRVSIAMVDVYKRQTSIT